MISTTTTTAGPYVTNGSAQTFTFAFPVAEASDVQAWHTDALGNLTQLVYGTDYTVSTVAGIVGGSITTTTALDSVAAPGTIFLKRVLPVTQPTSIRNQGAYYPEVVEAEFDRLTMVDQQQGEQLGRSLHMPVTDTTTSTEVPEQVSDGTVLGRLAGKFVWLAAASAQLSVDLLNAASGALGAALVSFNKATTYTAGTVGSFLNDLGTAATTKGAALIGYLAPYTGAVVKTLQDVVGDFPVSIKWFGADPTGLTDSTSAVAAAMGSGASKIHGPAGTYLIGTISVPSNILLYGDGYATVFKLKNGANADAFSLSGVSNVTFRDFRVEGNSANQIPVSLSNGFYLSNNAQNINFYNVLVNDHYDWGFNFNSCTQVRAIGCTATNGRAGANANAVRAGFLFGDGTPHYAYGIECTDCAVTCSNAFVDGFMSEVGNDHRLVNCRTAVAYTGFKMKGNNTSCTACYAAGGVQGYQTQTSSYNNGFFGCTAYRCGDSGFYLSNVNNTASQIGLSIVGCKAIECGQAPASTSYGFAFECGAGCTIDQVVLEGNHAIDNQAVKTQTRGISFGASGTVSNVIYGGNFCKGNTVDIYPGTSLQLTSYTKGWNVGPTGAHMSYAHSINRLEFYYTNLPASSGTVMLTGNGSTRGYVMPRAGYLRSLFVRGSQTTTAGNATFQVRVNGTINSSFNTQINTTNPTFLLTEAYIQANPFNAGDVITVSAVGDANLAPSGTTSFDACVEVVYA